MVQFLNQHSYLLTAGAVLVLIALAILWLHSWQLRLFILGTAVVALALAQLALRTGEGTLTPSSDIDAVLQSGKPAIVEFYSDL